MIGRWADKFMEGVGDVFVVREDVEKHGLKDEGFREWRLQPSRHAAPEQ
jgi:hypothetical protein